jgi:hypothetical protein
VTAPLWALPAFAVIAAAYASVGLGGASAYAAVLSLTDVPYAQIPPLVLTLNLLVAGGAYATFHRAGRVPYATLLPLVLASVPAAFAGGLLPLRKRQFLLLLAFALFLAGVRFLLGSRLPRRRPEEVPAAERRRGALIPLGLALGLLAGMTGIGGGVYLGPLLLFYGYITIEALPALTSGFIFFNSASGLAAHLTRVRPDAGLWAPLGAAVLVGALGGAAWTVRWPSATRTQRVLGLALIAVAAINLWKAL